MKKQIDNIIQLLKIRFQKIIKYIQINCKEKNNNKKKNKNKIINNNWN